MTDYKNSFKKCDSVRVKDGAMLPDVEDLCIGGWQGRILDFSEDEEGQPLVEIELDSITLKSMPTEYIIESVREGFDYTRIFLHPGELESASPQDNEEDVKIIQEEMELKYSWYSYGAEGERILEVIGDTDMSDDIAVLEAWEKQLKKALSIPFEAEVDEDMEYGPLQDGDKVTVVGFEEFDDMYGILVEVRKGRKTYVTPLCDLAVEEKSSSNYLPVNDYRTWFANH